ncbi:putative Na+/H+ antiporter [Caballeronia arationis]|uniref:putative Na+/H+ antiporter n=1 Tax=Caballeronia arationis TaxID=1777142 RepID=UPI003134545B
MILCFVIWAVSGSGAAVSYLETRKFTEPLFVFVIMVVAASGPILELATQIVHRVSVVLPVRSDVASVWLSLSAVPLLGSLITEPAAMTLAALLLRDRFFTTSVEEKWKYGALAVLFVNVSIGGRLTAYAAPPVLMVASTWGWNTAYMARTFGWKAVLAVLVNATVLVALIARRIQALSSDGGSVPQRSIIPFSAQDYPQVG